MINLNKENQVALITCHECQNQVSTESKNCPHCGARVKKPNPLKKEYSGKPLSRGALLVIAFFVVTFIGAKYIQSQKSPEQLQSEAVERQNYEKKKAEDAIFRDQQLKREDIAGEAIAAVRKTSRNPDTVVWERIATNDDASVICITARLENGFGGMVREKVAAVNGSFSNKSSMWNKHCANKSMFNVTRNAEIMSRHL